MVSLHHMVSASCYELRSRDSILLGWLYRPTRGRYLLALLADVQSDPRTPEKIETRKGREELDFLSKIDFSPSLELTARGFLSLKLGVPPNISRPYETSCLIRIQIRFDRFLNLLLGVSLETEIYVPVSGQAA